LNDCGDKPMTQGLQELDCGNSKAVWEIFPDHSSLLDAALEIIRQCEATCGRTFSIVLAGGHTPRALYRRLASEPMHWAKWRVYFGDERCLPPDHPHRNSRLAREALLERVPIAAEHIFTPPAELGPVAAASRYGAQLAGAGEFDLVLLGLGEDGHTASLFPGNDAGLEKDAADAIAILHAPKPPPERVSLSARRLSHARQVVFLVTGESKRDAVGRWCRGESLPAGAISGRQGTTVLLDEAAGRALARKPSLRQVR
jgi:6-phosphogluconolactonase